MAELLFKVCIPGRPAILKNRKQIIHLPAHGNSNVFDNRGKPVRPMLIDNKPAKEYRKRAVPIIRNAWQKTVNGNWPIEVPVSLRITFYLAMHIENNSSPDQSNLLSLPEDMLQDAGVLKNDRLVQHHDGSRRVFLCDCACPKKELIKSGSRKGQLKDDCGAITKCPYQGMSLEIFEAKVNEHDPFK